MSASGDIGRVLRREHLPPEFERWHVDMAPGEERPTSGAEWAGAVVLIERGTLEVVCLAGGSRTFEAGDLLVLGVLPLRLLRNRGTAELRLQAVRRAGQRETRRYLWVRRAQSSRSTT